MEKLTTTEYHEGIFTSNVTFIHLLVACVTHHVTLTPCEDLKLYFSTKKGLLKEDLNTREAHVWTWHCLTESGLHCVRFYTCFLLTGVDSKMCVVCLHLAMYVCVCVSSQGDKIATTAFCKLILYIKTFFFLKRVIYHEAVKLLHLSY